MKERKRFEQLLKALLHSECEDYGIEYVLDFEDSNECSVTLTRDEIEIDLKFRYYPPDSIGICLYEDTFETVRYFDWTVKYFWMKVAPYMFPV